jgi:hypothetical protein
MKIWVFNGIKVLKDGDRHITAGQRFPNQG